MSCVYHMLTVTDNMAQTTITSHLTTMKANTTNTNFLNGLISQLVKEKSFMGTVVRD